MTNKSHALFVMRDLMFANDRFFGYPIFLNIVLGGLVVYCTFTQPNFTNMVLGFVGIGYNCFSIGMKVKNFEIQKVKN